MNEFEQLGKRMSTDAVASLVAMHENSVYRHARELGGVKIGRRWVFFEQNVLAALRINHANNVEITGVVKRSPC